MSEIEILRQLGRVLRKTPFYKPDQEANYSHGGPIHAVLSKISSQRQSVVLSEKINLGRDVQCETKSGQHSYEHPNRAPRSHRRAPLHWLQFKVTVYGSAALP